MLTWPPSTETRFCRSLLALTGATLLLLFCTPPALSSGDEPKRRHAHSLIGDPSHGPDFQRFDWVNADAPKSGKVRLRGIGTFDNLNRFTFKGNRADGLYLINDTLMAPSLDETTTDYGLIAAWVSYPDDCSSATFGLRPEARFHDGQPITPEDVIFSLTAIKAADKRQALYYQNVTKVEKTGPHEVTFIFDVKGNRELPSIVGNLVVLPRHYWQGKDTGGETRDLTRTTMEVPLGSGPYRIREVDPGRRIVYERIKDWWAKDLPVARGQWNFEEISYTYFRDRVPAFEDFKSGKIDFWPENSAKAWATQYEFDALKQRWVRREALQKHRITSMQGFAFNLRRKQFQDPRVRLAFNLAYDHEWANKQMFFGLYSRVESYFDNSELKAAGLPQGRELELLEEVREDVPAELFTQAFKNPVNDSKEDKRRNMAQATQLLAAAGWTQKGGTLVNAAGEPFTVEFLLVQPDFERLVLVYREALEKLGIKVSVRTIDDSHYVRRVKSFDFDIVVAIFPQSISPGNEQRDFWSSAAADQEGTHNIIGIKHPAIDKLIDRIIFAGNRAELVAATRALDRVLLWGHYVVPQMYSGSDWIAYWNRFGSPEKRPRHASTERAFLQVWWHDDAAARSLAEARAR